MRCGVTARPGLISTPNLDVQVVVPSSSLETAHARRDSGLSRNTPGVATWVYHPRARAYRPACMLSGPGGGRLCESSGGSFGYSAVCGGAPSVRCTGLCAVACRDLSYVTRTRSFFPRSAGEKTVSCFTCRSALPSRSRAWPFTAKAATTRATGNLSTRDPGPVYRGRGRAPACTAPRGHRIRRSSLKRKS